MVMEQTCHPGTAQYVEQLDLRKTSQDGRYLASVVADGDSQLFGAKEMWIRIVGERLRYMEKDVGMRLLEACLRGWC